MKLTKRGDTYYLVKRVPEQFASIEVRKQVWISLRTDSHEEAVRRANDVLRELENLWVSKIEGKTSTLKKYSALSALAASRGYPYIPAEDLSKQPVEEIVKRTLEAKTLKNDELTSALLGAVDQPPCKLSDLPDIYFELRKVEAQGKSENQRRVWKSSVVRSFVRLQRVIGDKSLSEVSRTDALAFRAHWANRIEEEGVSASSANREIAAISGVLGTVHRLRQIGDPMNFRNLRFSSKRATRPPYATEFISQKILPAVSAGGLNHEAAAILNILVNTGLRPSEASGLTRKTIFLEAEIPYIAIQPTDDREIKTQTSIRQIPLVGIALEAAKKFPEGFRRYYNKEATLSQTLNKFLKTNDLKPTQEHCLYSFRHSFQDRLTAVEAPDRIQADLMGHRYVRERYGAGPSLAQKAEWLERVAVS